jgi:hypothetical protein
MEDEHMDHMDNFRERFEALERRTQMVEQRLRWWRGIACGVVMLSLLSLALPSGKAADAPGRGMADRMATLEKKLVAMDFDDAANEVVISGANLRIVNDLGSTETINGLGNLIVGYNELRSDPNSADVRTGSHNVVVGENHNFSSFGGLVVGLHNEISGEFASVSGGDGNTASGIHSSVSGGLLNRASSDVSWVTGGDNNTASDFGASVCGGLSNMASGTESSVSGGFSNIASGTHSSVSGGQNNTASGNDSSVSGGRNRTAEGDFDWVAGPLFADE